MKYSIVIPTYGKLDLVQTCVQSIQKYEANTNSMEIIVVDDFSSKYHRMALIEMSKDLGFRVALTEKNGGFAKAINIGMRVSEGEYIILCNNDVEFTMPVLSKFKDTHRAQDAAIVGCKLFYPNGIIQHGGVEYVEGISGLFCHTNDSDIAAKSRFNISTTFALVSIRREFFEGFGGLDEEFRMACEDSEYCLRAWRSGNRVYYNAEITAVHAEGATRGRTQAEKIRHPEWLIAEMESNLRLHYKLGDIHCFLAMVDSANGGPIGTRRVISSFERGLTHKPSVRIKRTGALGDVILTTPLIQALVKEGKEVHVTTDCVSVFDNLPCVTSVNSNVPCDRLIDLDLVYERNPKQHIVDAYADFAECPESKTIAPILHKTESPMPRTEKYVVLHPAVSWENRTWDKGCWEEVAITLKSYGYEVLTVGNGGDHQLKNALNVRNLTIHQVAGLIDKAAAFIGTDSGVLHIAATLPHIPIVGIFTCAKGEYRIPRKDNAITVRTMLDCYGCLHEETPPVTFVGCKRGDFACVREITPKRVLEAFLKVTPDIREVSSCPSA